MTNMITKQDTVGAWTRIQLANGTVLRKRIFGADDQYSAVVGYDPDRGGEAIVALADGSRRIARMPVTSHGNVAEVASFIDDMIGAGLLGAGLLVEQETTTADPQCQARIRDMQGNSRQCTEYPVAGRIVCLAHAEIEDIQRAHRPRD